MSDFRKTENKLTKHGYIFSENKYLEEIVLHISRGGKAKNKFRRIFETNALLFVENKLNKIVTKQLKSEGSFPIQYWAANSQRMAKIICEKLLKEIERGNFDFCDEYGNVLLKEDGSPKIRNLGGAIWKKMKYIFSDLLKGVISPYRNDFVDYIPEEKKIIEYLDEAIEAEDNPFIAKKLEAERKNQKKKLKVINTLNQFVSWMKDTVEIHSKNPIDSLLNINENKKEILIECFKLLSPTEKKYAAFSALQFLNKDIAEVFNVKPPTVTQTLKNAMHKLIECFRENSIDSISALFGG